MNVFRKIFNFYYNGFKSMTVGKSLWIIILIKLFIMFVVLRIFFFPNYLKSNFNTDEERSKHVIEELTKSNKR
jgi:flagellar basal body-associated protein FliL